MLRVLIVNTLNPGESFSNQTVGSVLEWCNDKTKVAGLQDIIKAGIAIDVWEESGSYLNARRTGRPPGASGAGRTFVLTVPLCLATRINVFIL